MKRPVSWSDFFKSLVTDPQVLIDREYQVERERADRFKQEKLDPPTGELLLSYAREHYSEMVESVDGLNKKRDGLIKFVSGMIAFLFASIKALDVPINVAFVFTFACFLIALMVLLLSHRAVSVPAQPTIQDIRQGIGLAEQPHDWIAASLHKSSFALCVFQDLIAAHLNFALVWIVIGLFLLLPGLWWLPG